LFLKLKLTSSSFLQVTRDHVLPVRIAIAGNKDKVKEAKVIITELIKYYHTSVTHPGLVHAEMDVPPNLYKSIIGTRGAGTKLIQANFKVSVHIPNVDSVNKSVVIVGSPEGVKGAEDHIMKIMDAAIADREAAEKMADSWVDGEAAETGNDDSAEQVTSMSSRQHASDGSSALSSISGFNSGAASAAIAVASASGWGASILASADGW
jgi:rRNA processing protein Krr1/Pno1